MRQPQSIRFHLAGGVSGFLSAGLRARLVQHLAAEQFQPAVGRRRRGLAADHARARRSQQFHLGLPRHRRQQSVVDRPSPRSPRPRRTWRSSTARSRKPSAASSRSAHDPAENDLYDRFKARWTDYRKIVNQMLELSRNNRKAEALAIYGGTSRVAYNAASDTLGQLTDQAVASAQSRQRSSRGRLSPGVLAHSARHGDRRRDGGRRAVPYQPLHLRPAAAISPTACAGLPPTTPISMSRKPSGATRSARWRRPPWCFATMPSS